VEIYSYNSSTKLSTKYKKIKLEFHYVLEIPNFLAFMPNSVIIMMIFLGTLLSRYLIQLYTNTLGTTFEFNFRECGFQKDIWIPHVSNYN
jgi:hypothetical protein